MQVLDRLRKVAASKGANISYLLDTKGPEIRTAMLKGGQNLQLNKGQEVVLVAVGAEYKTWEGGLNPDTGGLNVEIITLYFEGCQCAIRVWTLLLLWMLMLLLMLIDVDSADEACSGQYEGVSSIIIDIRGFGSCDIRQDLTQKRACLCWCVLCLPGLATHSMLLCTELQHSVFLHKFLHAHLNQLLQCHRTTWLHLPNNLALTLRFYLAAVL